MNEKFRENFFLIVRILLLIMIEIYILLSQSILTGASYGVFLLLALFVGGMAGKELVGKKKAWLFLAAAVLLWIAMLTRVGTEFLLLGVLIGYEILYLIKPGFFYYYIPMAAAVCIPSETETELPFIVGILIGLLYIQHDFVVVSYREQAKEDTLTEQKLKRNLYEREKELRSEINKGRLRAENQILEEKARLSQTLHDKLGHNINGAVYQLEAIKLLMKRDPETAESMIQAVLNQLRAGMDEIRVILRKEKPEKNKLALLQLQQLCDECSQKGVDAQLFIEGELSKAPEKYLEIILDNAFEAVSNALKYSKCTKIEIRIYIMNRMVRCSISDNGIGCKEVVDGMGIAGMRQRMRRVNGILNFETESGFTINMLLPL